MFIPDHEKDYEVADLQGSNHVGIGSPKKKTPTSTVLSFGWLSAAQTSLQDIHMPHLRRVFHLHNTKHLRNPDFALIRKAHVLGRKPQKMHADVELSAYTFARTS